MAKKAKKTSAKKTSKVTTTTKVVSKSAKKAGLSSIVNNRKKINDIDSIFSAKTISMLFVEIVGATILALIFSATQGQNHIYMLFVLVGLATVLANYSQTFFNPIISFGAWIANKISAKKMVLTIIAQFLGVMLAVILLRTFMDAMGADKAVNAMTPKPELFKLPALKEGAEWFVLGSELIASFVFGLFFVQGWKEKDNFKKGFVVGISMFAALIVGSILANYAQALSLVNPTYVLLTLNQEAKNLWQWIVPIYGIVPLLGGALGFLANELLVKDNIKTTVK